MTTSLHNREIGPSPGEDLALSVDVVVPLFDRSELTRACLQSLRRQTLAHAVVVADDASTDGRLTGCASPFLQASSS